MTTQQPILDVRWRTDSATVPAGHVAIVVDVLRASTNIITALNMGLKRVRAFTEVDDARRLAARYKKALLVGERHNRKIEGFDYGNSPLEISQDRAQGATMVFTSTNFPHALAAASQASCTLIGALVNCTAVSRLAVQRARERGTAITVILGGEPVQAHAIEDYSFAGMAAAICRHACVLSESAEKARVFMEQHSLAEVSHLATHAQDLIRDGFAGDVDFALTLDRFDCVPEVRGHWIVRASNRGQ